VPEIGNQLRLDSIITVVDAKHILQHLDEVKPQGVENESIEQLAFADRVLLNKIDLVTADEVEKVKSRIAAINTSCEVIPTQNSIVDLDRILNLRAFDLDKIMTMDPEFLRDQEHMHDTSVYSVGILEEGEADLDKLNDWIGTILREMGADIFRMKGVIAIKGKQRRYVFQGVHMLFGGSPQSVWLDGEKKLNKMVFIGRNLDRKALIDGFKSCLV
jgi:G3E family GTPase